MRTKVVRIDPLDIKEEYINEAGSILSKGGLVIIPTETVYGIAANMLDNKALDKLCRIKNRPREKKFSLHIDKKEGAEDFAREIPTGAYKLMDKFWPGPLTLILKSKDNDGSTPLTIDPERSRRDTIGIRMPDNDVALRIIRASGVPVVLPSANVSGRPAPGNFQDAIKDLDGLVDYAVDCGSTRLQAESTVVDLTQEPPRVLREGAIKKEAIERALGKKSVLFICTGNSCRSVMAKGLMEKLLKEKNRDDVEVLSAGVLIAYGLGATAETRELLNKEGIDASGHRSQRVTKDMVNRSDIILVMEKLHEERILDLAPAAKNKLFLLKEFAKIKGDNLDIPDPIGKPLEFYAQTFNTIKEAVERIIEVI